MDYEDEIEEGESTLIKASYTWENGTVEDAIGTIEFNGQIHDLEFDESTETYDYLFSESEGAYDFYVVLSEECFELQDYNGTIDVIEETTTTTTTTSSTTATTTTTTTTNKKETKLFVSAPSSIYSDKAAKFQINYTKGDLPVKEANVILTISHPEINLLTDKTYTYSESYFVPWNDAGFYYYSIELEPALYNYSVIASKDDYQTRTYEGSIVVKEVSEGNNKEVSGAQEKTGEQYFVDKKSIEQGEEQEFPKDFLKAALPIEGVNYSEIFLVFVLFGTMCIQVAIIVLLIYRNVKREEERMKFLLILMTSGENNEFLGELL